MPEVSDKVIAALISIKASVNIKKKRREVVIIVFEYAYANNKCLIPVAVPRTSLIMNNSDKKINAKQ